MNFGVAYTNSFTEVQIYPEFFNIKKYFKHVNCLMDVFKFREINLFVSQKKYIPIINFHVILEAGIDLKKVHDPVKIVY